MTNKVMKLIKGKTFDELVEIYEGFTTKAENFEIENIIVDAMEAADFDKFIAWSEEI